MPGGQWAYACKKCADARHMTEAAYRIGTIFKIREVKVAEGTIRIKQGIEPGHADLGYWVAVMYDGLREIKCPNCGESRSVEPDADYQYVCESCHTQVQVPEPLC